jgi:thioredoxin-related protein
LKSTLNLEGVPMIFIYNREHHQVLRMGGYDEKKLEKFLKVLNKVIAKK